MTEIERGFRIKSRDIRSFTFAHINEQKAANNQVD